MINIQAGSCVLRGQIYPDVSACHAIISEGKYVDNILLGCF